MDPAMMQAMAPQPGMQGSMPPGAQGGGGLAQILQQLMGGMGEMNPNDQMMDQMSIAPENIPQGPGVPLPPDGGSGGLLQLLAMLSGGGGGMDGDPDDPMAAMGMGMMGQGMPQMGGPPQMPPMMPGAGAIGGGQYGK